MWCGVVWVGKRERERERGGGIKFVGRGRKEGRGKTEKEKEKEKNLLDALVFLLLGFEALEGGDGCLEV